METYIIESFYPRIFITERYFIKCNISFNRCKLSYLIAYLRYFGKELIDALLRGFCLLYNGTYPAHRSHRPSEHHHVNTELYNYSNRLYFTGVIELSSNKDYKDKTQSYHQYHCRDKKSLYLRELNIFLTTIFGKYC